MKNYYLNLLLCFWFPIYFDNKAKFTGNEHIAEVILPDLFLSGFAIPVESLFISLLVCLMVYLVMEHNARLLSHEKFKIAINMLHKTSTPLTLLRNELEGFAVGSISELTSQKLKQMLEFTDCIIGCNQNIMALDRVNRKAMPEASAVEFELYTYILSIVNQCRPYAGSRQVQLRLSECSDYISCTINESIMSAALQHLLNRMIEIATPGSCVHIHASHTADVWKLHISNGEGEWNETGRMFPFLFAMFPIHGYSDLRTVRKIIRLHGGRIICYRHGKAIALQVVIPMNGHCLNWGDSGINIPAISRKAYPHAAIPVTGDEKQVARTDGNPCVLLVMADRLFSDYLEKALSEYFQVSVLDNSDQLNASARQNPDAIIIDENVNGVNGDELCLRIKADKVIADIPVMILVRGCDNESYLSHAGSGADRLELRTVNICKLKVDIRMLINNHMALLKRTKQFLTDTFASAVPGAKEKSDKNLVFIIKVRGFLEENLAIEKYSVKMLSIDMGMSSTSFFTQMKLTTGMPPEKYMLTFKMEKAVELLASGLYNVTEIAGRLGFCDAKYFGKRFKEFYHVCPTKYIESNEFIHQFIE